MALQAASNAIQNSGDPLLIQVTHNILDTARPDQHGEDYLNLAFGLMAGFGFQDILRAGDVPTGLSRTGEGRRILGLLRGLNGRQEQLITDLLLALFPPPAQMFVVHANARNRGAGGVGGGVAN